MTRWKPLLLAAALLAAGCGKPLLDSKDLDRSSAKLRDSLDESRQIAFDGAIDLVRQASTGEVTGTSAFALDGMSAEDVLAEADRIDARRERALEVESAAVYRELLAADERLARLRVIGFVARPIGDTRMEADLTVRNDLDFAVATAWLSVEVTIPGGGAMAGEEFISFQPLLRKGEQRRVHMLILGGEARSLPVEPPAELHTRFTMAEGGGQTELKSPTDEERQKATTSLAESEKRIQELDARLATLGSRK